jgi:hypothetical protein
VRTHPYAEAVYEVVALAAGGFGVKVSTLAASPATVSSFETVAAAEAVDRGSQEPRREPIPTENDLSQTGQKRRD